MSRDCNGNASTAAAGSDCTGTDPTGCAGTLPGSGSADATEAPSTETPDGLTTGAATTAADITVQASIPRPTRQAAARTDPVSVACKDETLRRDGIDDASLPNPEDGPEKGRTRTYATGAAVNRTE